MLQKYRLLLLTIPVIIFLLVQNKKTKAFHFLKFPSHFPSDTSIVPSSAPSPVPSAGSAVPDFQTLKYPTDSWYSFLQHLPAEDQPIVDYKGNPVSNPNKGFRILTYDVGRADLQQCADALMRIRAEFLFSRKKYEEIGFHFCSGIYYPWTDYLRGKRPLMKGNNQVVVQTSAILQASHNTLREYLDIVYAYANTVSLCRELKQTDRLETGTVIIYPGNPGHCCMIIDEAIGYN